MAFQSMLILFETPRISNSFKIKPEKCTHLDELHSFLNTWQDEDYSWIVYFIIDDGKRRHLEEEISKVKSAEIITSVAHNHRAVIYERGSTHEKSTYATCRTIALFFNPTNWQLSDITQLITRISSWHIMDMYRICLWSEKTLTGKNRGR